jgi:Na+/alanine symporter
MGPLIDTLCINTMTALSILLTLILMSGSIAAM